MHRHTLFSYLALVCLFLASACALAHWRPSSGRLLELAVVDRASGAALPVLSGDGQGFVEGRPGQRYAIRLTNRSAERVLAVLSVDGINAVSGQTAAPNQAGYVLDPWQSTEVTGWRKSLSEVAGFAFSELPDSYAARTGRPDNVGVIGIAVFRERRIAPAPSIADRVQRQVEAAERGVMSAPNTQQALGTAHGPRESSQVARTNFERASSQPDEVVTLRYDRRENLVALGVLPPPPIWPREPAAFPGGFVPDP